MESRLFAWKAGGDMDGGEERWGKELEHWDLLQIKPGVKKNTMVAEDGNQLDGRAFPYRSASQIERWMVPSGRAVKAVDRAETRSHLWKGRSPMTKDRIIQRSVFVISLAVLHIADRDFMSLCLVSLRP